MRKQAVGPIVQRLTGAKGNGGIEGSGQPRPVLDFGGLDPGGDSWVLDLHDFRS